MRAVSLGEGPFLAAQQRGRAYLLSLEPDRMLHNFRRNAGLEPKAPIYGGWESVDIWADIHCQGHTLGHYLSACAMMFAATGEAEFGRRVDYMVGELAACQAAANSGLVCAFPEGASLVARFIAGEKISGVPWYTLHKVFAGLRDAHQLARSAKARVVLLALADWAVAATRGLDDARFEAMLGVEHGGMNEIFADLYASEGRAEYAAMARRFSHKALLEPLAKGEDRLNGLHANTQIPKVVGFQRVGAVLGDAQHIRAAEVFWENVVLRRSFATGGHGDNEHFFPPEQAAAHVFSAKGSETCGIYNMLKLTRGLFMQTPQRRYADFYEAALFNGILGSQDPDTGMVTYFQGARPGYRKLYNTATDSFWCCTGSGMENHAKYRDSIYFHDYGALYVNLFIASSVTWAERGLKLVQETAFPEKGATRLVLQLAKPQQFALRLRHPGWSAQAQVRVNGAPVAAKAQEDGYITLARRWRDGDVVELALEMAVRAAPLVGLPAGQAITAFTYGPLVLAADLGLGEFAKGEDIIVNERKYGQYVDRPVSVPKLAGEPAVLAGRIARQQGLEFAMTADDGTRLRLVPYAQISHQRYATYWSVRQS